MNTQTTKRTKFYLMLAYGTLVADVYLALASVATRMMQPQYRHYLPPFGSDGNTELSRSTVLLVVNWTAILAMGCLSADKVKSNNASVPGTLWFLMVLVIIWLVHLTPILRDLFVEAL